MAHVNATRELRTPYMKAEAAGKVYTFKKPKEDNNLPHLESALANNGWRSIASDLKILLYNIQNKESSDPVSDASEEMEREMDKLFSAVLEVSEIHNPEAKRSLKASLYRALSWDPEDGKFIYTAPAIQGTSCLVKNAIVQSFYDKNKQLTAKEENTLYRYYTRHLFATTPSSQSRRFILQFAYLQKMNSEEIHTYLTKWSLSDAIRWDDPWELAAAYAIACLPAREQDRAADFYNIIEECININETQPNDPENREYLNFIRQKEQQEYQTWVDSYHTHCQQNKRDAFLCHWAWLLVVAQTHPETNSVIPKIPHAELKQALPPVLRRLNAYVKNHLTAAENTAADQMPVKTPEDEALQQEIIRVMKNRHLRLVAATLAYARLSELSEKPITLTLDGRNLSYVPPRRRRRTFYLPALVFEIDTKEKATKTGKVPNRLSRYDVIQLGIGLALTNNGLNQLLTIGGFCPELYSRDIFEHALIRTLSELKLSLPSDGYRFGIKHCSDIRDDETLGNMRLEVMHTFLLCLEENYDQLDSKNRKICQKAEPAWVKECRTQEDSE